MTDTPQENELERTFQTDAQGTDTDNAEVVSEVDPYATLPAKKKAAKKKAAKKKAAKKMDEAPPVEESEGHTDEEVVQELAATEHKAEIMAQADTHLGWLNLMAEDEGVTGMLAAIRIVIRRKHG